MQGDDDQHSRLLAVQLRKDILVEEDGVEASIIRSLDPLLFHKWYLDSHHFHWARSFFKPSKDIIAIAEDAAREIQTIYNVSHFYAMHFRQGDFQDVCGVWGDVIDRLKCVYSPDQALQVLQHNFRVPRQAVVFVVPSYPLQSLGRLCQVYRCAHRELLPLFLHATEGLSAMVLAQHQFAVAMRSAHAFGNVYSSWSVELLAHMRQAGRLADVMNPREVDCPLLNRNSTSS